MIAIYVIYACLYNEIVSGKLTTLCYLELKPISLINCVSSVIHFWLTQTSQYCI